MLRSAIESEDWNLVVSTLLHELHCHSEFDLVSILRATIDEAHRRQEHKGRKGGKDKGKGKDVGKGGSTAGPSVALEAGSWLVSTVSRSSAGTGSKWGTA